MAQTVQKKDKIITRITSVISIIVLIVLAIWGIKSLIFSSKYEYTNDAQVDMYINPLTARVTGYIKEIRFDENQKVHKGDTLVIIDNSDYAVQQQAANAAVSNSQADIDVLNQNVEAADKDVLVSQSKIAGAKAQLDFAQKEYDRYKQLYDEESATGQQVDAKQTALEEAKANYESAQETVALAQAQASAARTQIKAAQAEVARRNAIAGANQLTMSYTVITAPYDGQMGRRTLQIGQLVQPGQTLAYIVDLSSGKWIIANYKETQVTDMKVGQKATIEVDALPGKKFTGTIESFSAATGSMFSILPPDNSTGNFVKTAQRVPVKINLDSGNTDLEQLAAGMNVDVSVKKL